MAHIDHNLPCEERRRGFDLVVGLVMCAAAVAVLILRRVAKS